MSCVRPTTLWPLGAPEHLISILIGPISDKRSSNTSYVGPIYVSCPVTSYLHKMGNIPGHHQSSSWYFDHQKKIKTAEFVVKAVEINVVHDS